MPSDTTGVTRRDALVAMGVLGTAATVERRPVGSRRRTRCPRIDTTVSDATWNCWSTRHRLWIRTSTCLRSTSGSRRVVPCDDWSTLFSHYLDSDLVTAGMSEDDLKRFLSPDVDPAPSGRCWRPSGRP